MTEPPTPPPALPTAPRRSGRAVLTTLALSALILAAGLAIWQLRPREEPDGRPLGEAQGLSFAAVETREGERLVIRRGAEPVWRQPPPSAEKSGYQRIELVSTDVDVAGGEAPDAVLYGWTGGAHCCIHFYVFDLPSGRLLGEIDQGDGDPSAFVPSPRPGAARAALPTHDDTGAGAYGGYAGSPMARILVAWNGRRFGLDLQRMAALGPDAPPAFWTQDPAIAAAILADDLPGDFKPGDVGARGDIARGYATHVRQLRAAMADSAPVAGQPESFIPIAAFLNEQVYKGHAAAGFAAVREALADEAGESPADGDGPGRDAALAHYAELLRQSPWFEDLNALNKGRLKALIDGL